MIKRTLCALVVLGALAPPAAGAAAPPAPPAGTPDPVVAPDAAAVQVTALDGTVVWVSGAFGSQVLMRRTPDGAVGRVPGAPPAKAYRSVDLGRDAQNRLVLTYGRCGSLSSCTALRDDLHGHRASIRNLTLARCSLTAAPSLWRTRMAYGLSCHTASRRADPARSGLYVKTGTGAPKRLPLPKDAVRFGITDVTQVDLRGTRVAAVAADIYSYVFSEDVTGAKPTSFLAAASEGDSDEHVNGLALAPGGVVWALTDAEHAGDPNAAIVYRLAPGGCLSWERLLNPAGPDQEGFRATGLAADAGSLFLTEPGTGIVTHAFAPEHSCTASGA